jgi:uncharacterized membrane protein
MPGQLEDQRSAANIYASLSSYVITASLGVIAAQAALATIVIDKRDHLTWFYAWMILGILASVGSIVLGGKGVAGIASFGFAGTWTLKPKHDFFNYQALFCLLGMAFLLFSLFSGTAKPENTKATDDIQRLSRSVETLQTEIDDLRTEYAKMLDQMKSSKAAERSRPTRQRKPHK